MTNLPDYFAYLCEIVCVDGRYTDESYWILAEELWNTDYTWVLEYDENRAKSVNILRYRYLEDGGKELYSKKPSVLEVLIMLSDVMFDLLDEMDDEDRRPMYFWEMIDNLGLSSFTDGLFRDFPERRDRYIRKIRKKIDIWLRREFEYDGRGSPFPLKDPRKSQINAELWDQMNQYIIENY